VLCVVLTTINEDVMLCYVVVVVAAAAADDDDDDRLSVDVEELSSMGVRLRLYGCERMRRERMIGECIVSFSSLPAAMDYPLEQWLTLEPRSSLSVCYLHL